MHRSARTARARSSARIAGTPAATGGGSGDADGHPVLDEVPGVVEGLRQGAQLARIDSRRVEQQEGALELGVVEELVERSGEPSIEGHAGRDLVEHLDLRGELRLDRVLAEDPLREGVQRADRGPVELPQRLAAAPGLLRSGSSGSAARSWSSRRMRSRSSAPAFSVNVIAAIDRSSTAPLDHERDDPADQRGGLARSGARLHEQGARRSVAMRSRAAWSVGGHGCGHRFAPRGIVDRLDRLGQLGVGGQSRVGSLARSSAPAAPRCRGHRGRTPGSRCGRRWRWTRSVRDGGGTRPARCPPRSSPPWRRCVRARRR